MHYYFLFYYTVAWNKGKRVTKEQMMQFGGFYQGMEEMEENKINQRKENELERESFYL